MKQLRISVIALLVFSLLTGVLYPLLVTGIAQLVFPDAANGSLLRRNGNVVGSALIGQPFSAPRYFWSRPSATVPYAYNAASSSGTNYGPLNPAFLGGVRKRILDLRSADSSNANPIPVDLVTESGSGLDPHITVAAAMYQVPRVARARNLPKEQVRSLVAAHMEGRQLGVLGEPRINVLELNIALDELPHSTREK